MSTKVWWGRDGEFHALRVGVRRTFEEVFLGRIEAGCAARANQSRVDKGSARFVRACLGFARSHSYRRLVLWTNRAERRTPDP
jgi:hypothetical protein